MRIGRGEFLGSLCGLTAGIPLAALGDASVVNAATQTSRAPARPSPGETSYAQSGEDLIASFIFSYLGIKDVTYLDVGAFDPVSINNTYYFYRKGFRGVLVEPNLTMCERLRAVRPMDTTLNAGIGVTAVREADYYIMSEPSWNTFSKEEADHMTRSTNGTIKVTKVVKMPLLDINDVIGKHFKAAPTFVSIDAEGWNMLILKSIDYRRFRPKVICVETLVTATKRSATDVPAFMTSQGYVARGGSFVNTIFVDGALL
jgi:FkbM family methyltransferase